MAVQFIGYGPVLVVHVFAVYASSFYIDGVTKAVWATLKYKSLL